MAPDIATEMSTILLRVRGGEVEVRLLAGGRAVRLEVLVVLEEVHAHVVEQQLEGATTFWTTGKAGFTSKRS